MILVLNEWVFHDLLFQNGDPALRETAGFMVAFQESEDALVIPAEERWTQKAFQLMTMSDTSQRQVSILLHCLPRDANRTIHVRTEEEPPIPQELLDRLPREDIYLVQA